MFEYLDFEKVDGEKGEKDLKLIALSTCGFCRRAKSYLTGNKYKFAFVDMDKLKPEIKKKIRAEFKERFGSRITFPALIIDETDHLTGFIEASWKLLLEKED